MPGSQIAAWRAAYARSGSLPPAASAPAAGGSAATWAETTSPYANSRSPVKSCSAHQALGLWTSKDATRRVWPRCDLSAKHARRLARTFAPGDVVSSWRQRDEAARPLPPASDFEGHGHSLAETAASKTDCTRDFGPASVQMEIARHREAAQSGERGAVSRVPSGGAGGRSREAHREGASQQRDQAGIPAACRIERLCSPRKQPWKTASRFPRRLGWGSPAVLQGD